MTSNNPATTGGDTPRHKPATKPTAGLAVQWPVESNIAFVSLSGLPPSITGDALQPELLKRGVRALGGGRTIRLVTHRGVEAASVPRIVAAYADAVAALKRG